MSQKGSGLGGLEFRVIMRERMSYCVQLPRLQGATEGFGDVCSTRKLLENPRFAVAQKNLGTMLMEEPASRFRCWDFGSRQFGKSTIGA